MRSNKPEQQGDAWKVDDNGPFVSLKTDRMNEHYRKLHLQQRRTERMR